MKRTLDTSDLDRYMGKRLEDSLPLEPVAANDIRRWVQAMHYPNRLHYDREFARESCFGDRLVAPQSFAITEDDGHGATPACIGLIPNSHLLFGGDEWWFYGPRILEGDRIYNERIPYDYVVKDTSFAGPTCFQRGDSHYYNRDGDKIATQRSTGIRYNPAYAVEMQSGDNQDEYIWSDEALTDLEEKKFEFISALHELGHSRRAFSSVSVGDPLPTRIIGPHTIPSLTTEWRAYTMTLWGAMTRRQPVELGWVGDMIGKEMDGEWEKVNPEQTDGAYFGPSRGHLFPRYARQIGMPKAYGYGASMGAWALDYLAGWAGEHGYVSYCNTQYRGPAFAGDITVMTGTVTDKVTADDGGLEVNIKFSLANQSGVVVAAGKAVINLPA